MQHPISCLLLILALTLSGCTDASKDDTDAEVPPAAEQTALKLEELYRDTLQTAEGLEVIMSRVTIPPNTSLPSHYHPGEEFVWVMKGSGNFFLEDAPPVPVKAGDAMKVPLRAVHSFTSSEEPTEVIVFRVHERGQPERILVD